jgi:hypothetical protein
LPLWAKDVTGEVDSGWQSARRPFSGNATQRELG